MEKDVFQHVMDKLVKAEIQSSPFTHFYIQNVFPKEFYQELLANFPETSSFKKLSQTGKVDPRTYAERLVLPLQGESFTELPFGQLLFWSRFNEAINSDEWHAMLLGKFGLQIRERFGVHYDRLRFSSTAELVQDSTNYSIGPHTDHPIRVLTLLFYFPSSKEQSHLGTAVYQPLDESLECEGFTHHPFQGFKKLYTAPFLPNSLFGFIRSNRSFHGREVILDKGIERNLMNYYLQWNHK
jgi:hypothetical protein